MSPVVVRSIPFGIYILFLALEGFVSDQGGEAVRLWLYPAKVGLVALALWWLWPRFTELRQGWAGAARQLPLALLAGVVVFVLWIGLNEDWMRLAEPGEGYHPVGEDGQLVLWLVLARVAGAALVVPLMEELFWRSFLQRWVQAQDFMALEPARIGVKALLVASALFAVEHTQWLAGLVAGLVYGWLYIRTSTLWVPIVAHAVTNGLLAGYVLMTGKWYFW